MSGYPSRRTRQRPNDAAGWSRASSAARDERRPGQTLRRHRACPKCPFDNATATAIRRGIPVLRCSRPTRPLRSDARKPTPGGAKSASGSSQRILKRALRAVLAISAGVERAPVAIRSACRTLNEVGQFSGAAPSALWLIDNLRIFAKGKPGVQHIAAGKTRRAASLHTVADIGAGERVRLHQGGKARHFLQQPVLRSARQIQDPNPPAARRSKKVAHRASVQQLCQHHHSAAFTGPVRLRSPLRWSKNSRPTFTRASPL